MFGLGVYGALTQTNAIRVLMCIELMLNSGQHQPGGLLPLSPRTRPWADLRVFVMTVAAAEAAVGLAIILMIARRQKHIDIDKINLLKW